MLIRHKSAMVTGLLLGGALLSGVAGGQTPVADPEAGNWQPHKYTFNYFGFTSIYSCSGLEDKLKLLLKMSGAGQQIEVVSPCSEGFGRPDRLAMAYLTFSSLQPGAGAQPAAADGEWRHVSVSPRHPFEFERGDCELVEEFRDKVLPLFTIRNLDDNVRCVPYQEELNYSLSYDVFAPPLPPKAPGSKKS